MKHWILIVDDDKNQCQLLSKIFSLEGFGVHQANSGRQALKIVESERLDFMISDLRMPDMSGLELYRAVRNLAPQMPFIIITAFGTVDNAVAALKEGVYDYITKPVDTNRLLNIVTRALEFESLKEENISLKQQLKKTKGVSKIIGNSAAIRTIKEEIAMVAQTDATVLIFGESGTGKELVAEAIHFESARAEKPFIPINCAAIPDTLIESELFGYQKGAFTGAVKDQKGKFAAAHKGTIFLDEIGDLPPATQVKLLRVLQERQFEPLGSHKSVTVDIRIIAATHRNLEAAVSGGEFRDDLYYRLKVVSINLPPLRDRGDDLVLLADYFVNFYSRKYDKNVSGITTDAVAFLKSYSWPGNVRELENCVEHAVVMNKRGEIAPENLPDNVRQITARRDVYDQLLDNGFAMEEFEKNLIETALKKTGGNQVQAAQLLGISRRTLQYRAEKFGLL